MESANTVSATAWYLLRSECMFHVAKRIPGEEGTDGSDDGGGGGGGGGGEADGQCGSTAYPSVLVRRTYFGHHCCSRVAHNDVIFVSEPSAIEGSGQRCHCLGFLPRSWVFRSNLGFLVFSEGLGFFLGFSKGPWVFLGFFF